VAQSTRVEWNQQDGLDQIRKDLQDRHDEWYAAFERARDDSRVRYEDLVAHHERLVAEFEQLSRRHGKRFDKIDRDIDNGRQVTREMLLELREGHELLRDCRHGIQTSIEGLLRVLDEFRKRDGESPAGA
jgi:phosphoenolpyruvate carboxylase